MHTHRRQIAWIAGAAGALAVATVVRLSAGAGAAPPVSPFPAAQAPAAQKQAAQTPAKPPAPSAAAASPDGYVGDDTCITCHENQTLKGTPHGRDKDGRTPAAKHGCETCHGPGQAHVDAEDNKGHIKVFSKKAVARDTNAMCLSCHERGTHALWDGSAHDARNLSCATCHSVHSPKSTERQLVKATQTELCATCHRLQVAKTERAVAHMPVREGKMSCSSCHNPHGSIKIGRAHV